MTTAPIVAGTDVGDSPGGKFQSRTGLFKSDGTEIGPDMLAKLVAIAASLAGASYFPATQPVSATALPLPTGAASEAKLEAVRLLLAASLPLPTGAATDAKVEAVRALLAGTLAVSASALPLPTGAATEAKLETVRALLALTAPADNMFSIAPSDSADLAQVPKALLCSVAGNVSAIDAGGVTSTFPMTAGQVLSFRARRVRATGTTATLFGMY